MYRHLLKKNLKNDYAPLCFVLKIFIKKDLVMNNIWGKKNVNNEKKTQPNTY